MAIEEFIGQGEAASPIDHDDASASVNITSLSLPESFDDSLCLDLYKEFKGQGSRRREAASDQIASPRAAPSAEQRENAAHTHNDLEVKVRELLSANLELKEKARLHDALKKRSLLDAAEIEDLRSQLQHQVSLHDRSEKREKELQHQVLEHRRKLHLLGIDLEHARKEGEVFSARADKAEKEHEACASALKAAELRYERDVSRLSSEREEIKSNAEREIARIREESSREAVSARTHQHEAFARESKLLCDARDQAIEQAKVLQRELSDLRTDKDAKDEGSSEIIKELERQLADARSDLKVKSCELSTTRAEAAATKAANAKSDEALAQLRQEFVRLQCRCGKTEEALRLKDEALQAYHHDDLLADCGGTTAGGGGAPQHRLLVRNSVALARKCRELQSSLEARGAELAAERERNEKLSRMGESSQRLFRELTHQNSEQASAYIMSAVKARDDEISKLSSRCNSLRLDLGKVVRERDDLSSKLSQVLERREQLDEMRGLVEMMRNAVIVPATTPSRGAHEARCEDNERWQDDDDLLEHLVYRSKNKN